MKFTVVSLFNHKSFGLDEPHYAVVAHVPDDLGGGQKVLDLVAFSQNRDAEELTAGFEEASQSMPYRARKDGGGEIDFLAKDYQGAIFKQNTAYVPAKPLVGADFPESYMGWLRWRARMKLWLGDRDMPVVSESLEARVLETLSPQLKGPLVPPVNGFAVFHAAANNKAAHVAGYTKPTEEVVAPLLTPRPAPL